jgi:flagellar hook-length control protein FliK
MTDPVQFTVAAPSSPGAPQTMTIQLKPVELGRVEIRIERSSEGATKVELTVERTDTLMLLMRDQPQLQHALDQAGVPQHGRSVHFSLAADSSASTPAGSGSTLLGEGNAGGGGQRSGYHQGGGTSRGGGADADPATAYPIWTRSGLDITA